MAFQNVQEQMIFELSILYDAERRFLDAQRTLLREATDPQLQQGIRTHIDQTQQQVSNLERIFQILGRQVSIVTNVAAQGLVSAAEQALQEAGNEALRNYAIAGAIARVEHFEIACYTGLIIAAQGMGQPEIEALLQQNLQQEQQTAQQAERLAPVLLRAAMQAEGTQGKAIMGAGPVREEYARTESGLDVDVDASVPVDALLREME